MKHDRDDRRGLLAGMLGLAGTAALAGCAVDGVSYGARVDYYGGPGWGSPWYGYGPVWNGPVYVGPPIYHRPGYPTTLPSYPSRPVAPGPARPPLRPMPPPRPMPRPPPRPMPRPR